MSQFVNRFGARLAVLAVLLATVGVVLTPPTRPAEALAAGFTEQVVLTGLTRPTKVQFSADGRIFVAQKNGIIKVFDGLSDPTPTVFADLRTQVYDFEDLGLIGMALAPNFPADPYVYVSYTYDGPIGATAPVYRDACPVIGNCLASSRVSRLRADGDVATGPEQVLLHDWCQQIESHSVGDLGFGPDGALYVTGGEGASATFTDYGQSGTPANPCGDPPVPVGGSQTPPTAEGGALRAQDLRTSGDPTGLSGTLIRVDPATGAALPDNPMAGSTDPNNRRIVAYGLRNAFRWTFRPGTDEVWLGDVGWRTWEEIDRVVSPASGPVANYGWPCYEGTIRQGGYRSANLNLCTSLYAAPAGTVTMPWYAYAHSQVVVTGDNCPTGGSSPSGLAFYPTGGGTYPDAYAGALFFADYSRGCIWAMRAGADGLPDPTAIVPITATASGPVDLRLGPDNELYYVDLPGGTVRRLHHNTGNRAPTAVPQAIPSSGTAPLTVTLDGSGSSDPDPGDALSYQWDLTGDGTYDVNGAVVTHTYPTVGKYAAKLRVTDLGGLSSEQSVLLTVGASAPVPVIDTPLATDRWRVGQTVTFSGHATDPQDGPLPASALTWHLLNHHCTDTWTCHTHLVQDLTGLAGGSFVAPDHEYPSYLELQLTATDSAGLTASTNLRLDPDTVDLAVNTVPSGLHVNVNGADVTTPGSVRVIIGATTTLSAPSPQGECVFDTWSDGKAQTHVLTAPATSTDYTATFGGGPGCGNPGYVLSTATNLPFATADPTVLPVTGDDTYAKVSLPFSVPFYARSQDTIWVSSNGFLSFADPGGSQPLNSALPNVALPNAALCPFWDDLVVRYDSTVRMGVTGTAPNRWLVVEWRNIGLYGSTSARITFSVAISEVGEIRYHYADLASTKTRERGDSATVGLEDAAGTGAVTYSVNQPSLVNGTSIVFRPTR